MRVSHYSESAFPGQWRVLWLKLKPFTLGHALLLDRLNSPFGPKRLSRGTSAAVGDLALAILVCANDWRSAASKVDSLFVKVRLYWGAARVWPEPRRSVAVVQLMAYLRAAWKGPRILRLGDASDSGTPCDAVGAIVAMLVSRLGMTHEQALDLPVARALWLVSSYWVADGSVQYMSREDVEAFEEAERILSNA